MFNLNTRTMNQQIQYLLTYDDVATNDTYMDTVSKWIIGVSRSETPEETSLFESTIMAIDDMMTHYLFEADDKYILESYSKYIDYVKMNNESDNRHNHILEFFDYVIGDYINNNIVNETQQINDHISALRFKGLNLDVDENGSSPIYESDMHDFVNILHECNLLSDEFIDYYTNTLTESFISSSSEFIQSIGGKGGTSNVSTPINSNVMEHLVFPNSDFVTPTLESLKRLQDIEEISSDEIQNVKDLIRDIYETDNKMGQGNSIIDDLYHKYFKCVMRVLDDNNSNINQTKWACISIGQALEKFYASCKCKFAITMVEIYYLTLIVKKVQIAEAGESINDLMYYIHRMRHILYDNSFDDNINRDISNGDGNIVSQSSEDKNDSINSNIEDLLSSLYLVTTTLDNGNKSDTIVSESTNDCSNQVDELTSSVENDIHKFHRRNRSVSSQDLINVLTESFEVLSDGSIKVTLPKKTTYMEEYASNHRLLKENQKVNDYEGMRYNLVYGLLLAESIENKVMYNKKIDEKSELYTDAIKARSFALNDITTYLPEVKKNLPDFDLNEFYRQVKAEKQTVKIDTLGTISGVKKIINYILLH